MGHLNFCCLKRSCAGKQHQGVRGELGIHRELRQQRLEDDQQGIAAVREEREERAMRAWIFVSCPSFGDVVLFGIL